MGTSCACGNCDCDDDKDKTDDCDCGHKHSAGGCAISHEDKLKLEAAIKEAGFEVQETPDGEIQILEK